jgi:hypothetical protein
MNLLNNIHLGAKTILAFYHYSSRNGRSCKNGERFSMNWDTNEPPTIAGFTGEDKTFLEFIAREANAKSECCLDNLLLWLTLILPLRG